MLAYIGLGIAATNGTPDTVRASWTAMEIIGWYVLVPLSIGSWLTGLVMALASRWGLFRHYWVLFSFVLTTLAVVVLVMHMPDVSSVAGVVKESTAEDLRQYCGDLFHAVLALMLLLAIQVLNLYKPAGMTSYGWRHAQRDRATRATARHP